MKTFSKWIFNSFLALVVGVLIGSLFCGGPVALAKLTIDTVEIVAANKLSGDLNLNTFGIPIKGVYPLFIADANNGAVAPDAAEILTSTRSVEVRQFSGTANQDVNWMWTAPFDLTGATISVSVICWVANAVAPANGEIVAFSISGDSIGNSDNLSAAAGGAQTSSLTADATYVQYDHLQTAYSSAITIPNLLAGESVSLALIRLVTTTDTYTQKIGVEKILVKISRKLTND